MEIKQAAFLPSPTSPSSAYRHGRQTRSRVKKGPGNATDLLSSGMKSTFDGEIVQTKRKPEKGGKHAIFIQSFYRFAQENRQLGIFFAFFASRFFRNPRSGEWMHIYLFCESQGSRFCKPLRAPICQMHERSQPFRETTIITEKL